ncbi:nickel-dependent hydrogenase large subunit [Massilibacillus massiliensis]
MKRIVVDPVTRIEGHLRLEIKVDEGTGKVEDALSSGTAWRGIEVVLKDRDPRDAWAYAQRMCGVCTTVHALAALRAVEDALEIEIPNNANYIRNIMAGAQSTQDHLVHFYHLHALDWISPLEAAKADPIEAAKLQNTVLSTYKMDFKGAEDWHTEAYPKEFPKATTAYFQMMQKKIKDVIESGQLGIFAAQWWDHPDYQLLPPELHLIALTHYLEMLDKQREIVIPQVIFGGKNPHPHYVVGGMPCSISMEDMNAPVNTERLEVVSRAIHTGVNAVEFFYLPDLLAIGQIYAKRGRLDGGGMAKERVMGFGAYPDQTYTNTSKGGFQKQLLVRCDGVVENFSQGVNAAQFYEFNAKDLSDPEVLNEGVEHSWYEYPGAEGKDLHPWNGVTQAKYTEPKEGTKTNWITLNEEGKYSWVKTPKWRGKMTEVGPLARYIVMYTKMKKGVLKDPTWAEKLMVDQVELVSSVLQLEPNVWMPTMLGRTIARGLDAQMHTHMSQYFYDKLIKSIKAGDTKVADSTKWEPKTWPEECKGVGLYEAARGSLSHWVVIKNGRIANYQAVVPSTWNACPRDAKGNHGPYEKAMIDTKVKILDKPLEILKVVRSFDPCMACATHLYNVEGKKIKVVTTDPYELIE